MITIGVVGLGFVGSAVARGFQLYAEIKTYDIDPRKSSHTFDEVINSDLVFVCLPTPMVSAEGGEANLSILKQFFLDAFTKTKDKDKTAFVIKSTVPIGTTSKFAKRYNLDILHSPEFLTARAALIDFVTPARNIVSGYSNGSTRLLEFYKERFPGCPVYQMDHEEAELVKYVANCFFATKVIR